jgi:AcrR family transcriptional regulator
MMRTEARAKREAEIHAAAARLVAERGYGATSMLTIAKAAKASNETLYRWYGDKLGLFKSMVVANTGAAKGTLDEALAGGRAPLETLTMIAPVLLTLVLSERAISLNRAAAADETGELGAAIAAGGRDALLPLIAGLMQQAMQRGEIEAPSAEVAAGWYFSLLIGDRQVRRVNRVIAEPTVSQVEEQAQSALEAFRRLTAKS